MLMFLNAFLIHYLPMRITIHEELQKNVYRLMFHMLELCEEYKKKTCNAGLLLTIEFLKLNSIKASFNKETKSRHLCNLWQISSTNYDW